MLWPMIVESTKKFWPIWMVGILGGFIIWQHYENYNLELELKEYKLAVIEKDHLIDQLQTQSEAQAKRLTKATVDAQKWHKEYLAKNDGIINANVPEDCIGAIQWAIRQAQQ